MGATMTLQNSAVTLQHCILSQVSLLPQRRIHCEKLLVPQVVMKFPEFYGTQSFIYAFFLHSFHALLITNSLLSSNKGHDLVP